MVKPVCLNGSKMNTNSSSAPIPSVGVYIAAASMVCFILIFGDVWAGFKRKKYWFPCRFFSINSVTLTLISTAGKIPVDLTTYMPCRLDQLSKLLGTVFICATMCFMLPSIAKNAEFDSYANVTALSIFVVSVVVNICIQMATGVIFNFIPEHAIILAIMLFLILRFWISVTAINVYKSKHDDISKDLTRNGHGNMIARLKQCYVYGYHSCPQLYSCRNPSLGDVATICMTCSIVLVEATIRSLISKHLRFGSDYGWSISLVLLTQTFTVALVTLAVGGRWLMALSYFPNYIRKSEETSDEETSDEETYLQILYLFSLKILPPFRYLCSLKKLPSFLKKSFKLIYLVLYLANYIYSISNILILIFVNTACSGSKNTKDECGISGRENKRDENSNEFKKLLKSHDVFVDDWALQKAVADVDRWLGKNENMILNHLQNLLSSVAPSQESPFKFGPNGKGKKISLLSITLLAKIAQVMSPNDGVSLTNVLAEVFEIILFIDSKVNSISSDDRLHSMVGTVIHHFGVTSGFEEFDLRQVPDLESNRVNFKAERKQKCLMGNSITPVEKNIHLVTDQVSDFISYRQNELEEVVYGRIKQVFVDMLHTYLAQLLVAIYNHILESPIEEYHDKVRLGLGLMSKLHSVKSHIRFLLPPGDDITRLFHTEIPATTMQQGDTLVECISIHSPPNITPLVEVIGEIQEDAQVKWEEV